MLHLRLVLISVLLMVCRGQEGPYQFGSATRVKQGRSMQTTSGTYSPLANVFRATILRSWPDNGGTRIEGMCVFKVKKTRRPKRKHFIIDFGIKVRRYEDWTGYRIEPSGDTGVWFHTKNLHWLQKPNLKYTFQATYDGNETPTVLCNSDLPEYATITQAPLTTTQMPVTSTQAPVTTQTTVTTTRAPMTTTQASTKVNGKLPYAFPATITNFWIVDENGIEGFRIDAHCVFAVDRTYEPNTRIFGIDFGVPVQNFINWAGTAIQPTGNAGANVYISNKYWINPDKFEIKFQATYTVNDLPTLTCKGDLPQFGTTSSTPSISTTLTRGTRTQNPGTTTQPSVPTTEEPDTTTEEPDICTNDFISTTTPPGSTTEALASTKTTSGQTTHPPAPVSTTQISATTTEEPNTYTTDGVSETTEGPQETTTTTAGQTTQPPAGTFDYNEVIKKSIWFYRAQRSGDLPEVDNDPVPWRGDSALYDGKDVGLDLSGGWYDAGDWVKFNLPISSAVATLGWGLMQWKDAYLKAGQYNAMLDCIKWPLDYFLKCWRADKQVLYGQIGNGGIDHSKMMRPEDMTEANMPRPSYSVTSTGSDLAGSMAAALAVGAIAFRDTDSRYSAQLLAAAESLYVFADTHRGLYTSQIPDAGSYYASSGYDDELVYAAAMLYKATGNDDYLNDAERKYDQFDMDYKTSWAFDWDDKLMAAKLLLHEATGKTRYSRDVQTFLNQWRPGNSVQYTPGGLAWRLQWGSLRYAANTAFIALMAADLGIDTDNNVAWAKSQIDYMLGDNPRGSSYVVGFGNNPPKQPHHKSSTCQPKPAPCDWGVFSDTSNDNAHVLYGALVGGPDASDNYVDARTDYVMAEVTCDYNAGFQSAVSGLVHFKN